MPSSSQPTTSSTPPSPTVLSSGPNSKQNAVWTDADIIALLNYLFTQVAAAGDGGNFKMAIFTGAVPIVNAVRTRGGPKTRKSCHGKYKALRKIHDVIQHIKLHASGFTWDDTRSACIDVASKSAWETYVKQHPDAKPFRNKGWAHLSLMEKLVPSQAKGTHVFRPSQAATPEDQEDDRQSTDPSSPGDPPSPPADYGAGPGSPTVWDIERGLGLREDDDEEDTGRSSVCASLF
ncbi:hypothetical protein C8R44DRAFT_651662 [Mycena epipterygia]|nr:hypothetical protein C8R44DRAFT_651662 [Mycena epipterygia]